MLTSGMSRSKLRKRASMWRRTVVVAAKLAAQQIGDSFAREVVFRGAEAAAGDDQRHALQRVAKRLAQAVRDCRPTIVLRSTSMPSLFSSSVRKSELVSRRSGVSSSEPTAMISAFMAVIKLSEQWQGRCDSPSRG